jgi:hypothetical protein
MAVALGRVEAEVATHAVESAIGKMMRLQAEVNRCILGENSSPMLPWIRSMNSPVNRVS